MFVCVQCCHPVEYIYRDFGNSNIRLATCPACGQIADKYVEFDTVNILIETILLREEVYRHLIYNRPVDQVQWRLSALETFLIILGCDLYSKWRLFEARDVLRMEALNKPNVFGAVEHTLMLGLFQSCHTATKSGGDTKKLTMSPNSPVTLASLVVPYATVVVACAFEQMAFLCAICLGVWIFRLWSGPIKKRLLGIHNLPESVMLARFGKVSAVLMIIWDVTPGLKVLLDVYILCGCLLTLRIFLNVQSHAPATLILSLGLAAKFAVQFLVSHFMYGPYPCSLAALLS
eukprot:Blabericola_migrator_1__1074@NODE_1273_length_4923_cov_16_538715_g858_i0_p1_GENE_NODE_1273_length_4923_cov_16_538715_g858_i0NODE_1273_length_4923_cov_16_538715_g858_i0_p1_ORF_typecomplete_len289_score34_22Arv1/PF04161_13/3_4e38zfTFIIB/PF13453_6/1_5zfTFIIB/PF13453_6/1_3e02_NODE_1273_length_4923_cov_16_538715_g858_i026373503